MGIHAALPLMQFANASDVSHTMQSFVTPVMATLCAIASLACAFFLVAGGIEYMTSAGKPEKLEHAKKILKNAAIGLAIVIGAAVLVGVLSHAYGTPSTAISEKLPSISPIETKNSTSFWDVIIKSIISVLKNIVDAIGKPFLEALGYFTTSTPLMADNGNVFNMWLAIVGIADVLLVIVVALLGFHVMSFATFGFDELDIKRLLPQIALVFLLMNTSIFIIDAVISLSNGMIRAFQMGFPCTSIWDSLSAITNKTNELGLAGLLIMISFLVLAVTLLVYYLGRIITLYLGALLSPLVLLLWLIPAFKDFAATALKTYLTTIFVLFVHVVILQLAASIFGGMLVGDNNGQPNVLMALLLGLAAVTALLKTQGVMQELSYAASGPRAAREMTTSFTRAVSTVYRSGRNTMRGAKKVQDAGKKAAGKLNSLGTKPVMRVVSRPASSSDPKPKVTVEKAPKVGETRVAEKMKGAKK